MDRLIKLSLQRKERNRWNLKEVNKSDRPRLSVYRTNTHISAQIIDDTVGNTLVSASTLQKDVKAELEKTNNVDAAAYLGTVIAKKAIEKGISAVSFDRGGYLYHGIFLDPYIHLRTPNIHASSTNNSVQEHLFHLIKNY